MQSGETSARHYRTGQALRVSWRNGAFEQFEPLKSNPESLPWIAPALVDIQVNGYAGVDFQRPLSLEQMILATRGLIEAGCAQYLPTLITGPWEAMMAQLAKLRQLRDQSPLLRAAIAGWHMEGPFLSREPGFRGAHHQEWLADPGMEHIEQLRDVAGGDRVLLTLAPERPGALAAIERAVALGITVSLGHTDASREILRSAVTVGARGFTHLGNATPQTLDRHDNILWRVFETKGLEVSLIADGIHVSPTLFRLAHRVVGRENLIYTTDAMSAAGAPPGRFTIGHLELEVGEDGIVRQPGRSNFAGSSLRPIDGVLRAAAMLGQDWRQAWDCFSLHPAGFIGLPHGLEVGKAATFCLVREPLQEGAKMETWLEGQPICG